MNVDSQFRRILAGESANEAVQDALTQADRYGRIISGVARAARAAEREKYEPLLQAIFLAYDRSAKDPEAKLPSFLMAAIVAARAAVKRG